MSVAGLSCRVRCDVAEGPLRQSGDGGKDLGAGGTVAEHRQDEPAPILRSELEGRLAAPAWTILLIDGRRDDPGESLGEHRLLPAGEVLTEVPEVPQLAALGASVLEELVEGAHARASTSEGLGTRAPRFCRIQRLGMRNPAGDSGSSSPPGSSSPEGRRGTGIRRSSPRTNVKIRRASWSVTGARSRSGAADDTGAGASRSVVGNQSAVERVHLPSASSSLLGGETRRSRRADASGD